MTKKASRGEDHTLVPCGPGCSTGLKKRREQGSGGSREAPQSVRRECATSWWRWDRQSLSSGLPRLLASSLLRLQGHGVCPLLFCSGLCPPPPPLMGERQSSALDGRVTFQSNRILLLPVRFSGRRTICSSYYQGTEQWSE